MHKYTVYSCTGDDTVDILMRFLVGDKSVLGAINGIPPMIVEGADMPEGRVAPWGGATQHSLESMRKQMSKSPWGELAWWTADYGEGQLTIRSDVFGVLKKRLAARPSEDRVRVLLNGREYYIEQEWVSYEDIVSLLGMKGQPSLVYSGGGFVLGPDGPWGDSRGEGTLLPGQNLKLCDGMKIDAYHTGNA